MPDMKTRFRLISLFCAASALLLIVSRPARAEYIVTLKQVGPDVVATGSGAMDLTGLHFRFHAVAGGNPEIVPFDAIITFQQYLANVDVYRGFTGPTTFGLGRRDEFMANTFTGDSVGIAAANPLFGEIEVPLGYVSGTPLLSSMTFNNATIGSLGARPGIYEWTWGTRPNQNFTLQIVPDPGFTFGLLIISFGALFGAARFCSLRLA
jgi:hypothetical protein